MHNGYMEVIGCELVCQNNSEFGAHEKACVLKKIFCAGKYAENERFRKWLITSGFCFLYIFMGA